MKAPKTVFACQECGAQAFSKMTRPLQRLRRLELDGRGARRPPRRSPPRLRASGMRSPQRRDRSSMRDIDIVHAERLTTGIGELDRVLGGGVVPGHWSCSAASRGSASRRCCCRPRRTSRRPTVPSSTARARSPSIEIKSWRGEHLGVDRAPLYILRRPALSGSAVRRDRASQAGLHHRRELDPDRLLAEV